MPIYTGLFSGVIQLFREESANDLPLMQMHKFLDILMPQGLSFRPLFSAHILSLPLVRLGNPEPGTLLDSAEHTSFLLGNVHLHGTLSYTSSSTCFMSFILSIVFYIDQLLNFHIN